MSAERAPFPCRTLLIGLTLFLLLQGWFVGLAGLFGSSEARELQVIDIILRTKEWILPLRNGLIPSKPPLYHWIGAIVSYPFGVATEWSGRMVSSLAAAVTLFSVAVVAYRFVSFTRTWHSAEHARRVALLSAGILSLTYGFFQMAGQAMVDMTFCMCTWLAIGSLMLGIRVSDEGYHVHSCSRMAFWGFCAIAAVARGPLGLLLPCCAVGIGLLKTGGLFRALKESLTPSLGWLFLILPFAWYYAAYKIGGQAFLDKQLFFENIRRFTGGKNVNVEAWWFYGPSLLRTTFPWGVIVLSMAIHALYSKHRTVAYCTKDRLLPWLPLIIAGVLVACFSLSSGKRHSYMLPLFPLIAIQCAIHVSSLIESGGGRMRRKFEVACKRTEALLSMLLVVIIALVVIALEGSVITKPYLQEVMVAISEHMYRLLPLALVVLLGLYSYRSRTLEAHAKICWGLGLLLMISITSAGIAVKSHLKGFSEMAKVWESTATRDDTFTVIKGPRDEYFDPILFYIRREVEIVEAADQRMLCADRRVYLTRARWLAENKTRFQGEVVEVQRLRERFATITDDTRRELVVFRCFPMKTSQDLLQTAMAHNRLCTHEACS
jgi:4-amino-4-deoxy-L-arabinose transferase-like glycosyltransferase